MRIPVPCIKCVKAGGKQMTWAFATINESGVHSGVCPSGHEVSFRLVAEPPHELLVDVGALALLDEYYREAVSSFAAGLEQSFAFYVEASMMAAGVDRTETRRLLSANRLAERRAGMVSMCFLRDTGMQFPYLQSKRAEFRNQVIHNAHWPSRADTVDFASYVCDAINKLSETLGPKRSALLNALEEDAGLESAKLLFAGLPAPATIMRPSFMSAYVGAADFEEALTAFAKTGWWKWPKGLRLVQ